MPNELCFECQRNIAECPWLHADKPVPEWSAKAATTYIQGKGDVPTWDIKKCPLYIPPDASRYKAEKKKFSSKKLVFCGKTLTELSKEYEINKSTLRARLERGMPLKDALTTPVAAAGNPNQIIARNISTGETRHYESISLAEKDGFSMASISRCISGQFKQHKGWTFERDGGIV